VNLLFSSPGSYGEVYHADWNGTVGYILKSELPYPYITLSVMRYIIYNLYYKTVKSRRLIMMTKCCPYTLRSTLSLAISLMCTR
jgi:hypothetical protein